MRKRLKKKLMAPEGTVHYLLKKSGKVAPIKTWRGNRILKKALIRWGRQFDLKMRRIANTAVSGDIAVSTVFLGLDHAFYLQERQPRQKPLVFETMIFGGEFDLYQERYTTKKAALHGHQQAVLKASAALGGKVKYIHRNHTLYWLS